VLCKEYGGRGAKATEKEVVTAGEEEGRRQSRVKVRRGGGGGGVDGSRGSGSGPPCEPAGDGMPVNGRHPVGTQ
jgi:hypothetical protein